MLTILHTLGVEPDERTAAGCDSFLRFCQHESGGFSMTKTLYSGIFPCTTGEHLPFLAYFDLGDDPRVRRAFAFLIEDMATEDALDCGRYQHRDCLWGAIAALKGLAVLPADLRSPQSAQVVRGLAEARTEGGLTTFGVELVREMNRLGMVIDVAHLAPAGVRDVLELSEAPVIASHANAPCPHRRNLTGEQLEAIAAKGGVVGVTFVPSFVAENKEEANLERLLDHIDHIVRVAGIDHVGLGSDFDGFGDQPMADLKDVTKLPVVTAGRLERGYSADGVKEILGGNFFRVFREVVG